MFIGLDLSLTGTGCAARQNGKLVGRKLIAPATKGVIRLEFIVSRIFEFLDPFKDRIAGMAVEGYSMGSKGRVFDLAELGGVVKYELRKRFLDCVIAPPTSLKMIAAGHGGADKARMKEAMWTMYGEVLKNDNEADAAGLAYVADIYFDRPSGLPKNVIKSLEKMDKLPTRRPD